jgi:hypothetical protein
MLQRHIEPEGKQSLGAVLEQWDRWSADVLETHISFPVLAYYRSQHDNQSWVAALTVILDVCALLVAGVDGEPSRSARLAFAMARHAAVDLRGIFYLDARPPKTDRLSEETLDHLLETLARAGLSLRPKADVDDRLHRLRQMYEPHMNALADFLLMPLPTWASPKGAQDNWQSMA